MTKSLAAALAIAWTVAGVNFAAEQTWTGKISDNLCNASHTKMATGVFPPFEDPQCVLECIKAGGKFVFVDKDDKPLQIANQDFEDLKKHPGVPVTLTGELKGDTITVTKIELAPTK
jgi:flagellar basal body rod protein FlgC